MRLVLFAESSALDSMAMRISQRIAAIQGLRTSWRLGFKSGMCLRDSNSHSSQKTREVGHPPRTFAGEPMRRDSETKSRSSLHSLAPARLLPGSRSDNCSSAIVRVIPPVLASPIAVHISQLFHAFLCRPHVEIVEARLPERSASQFFPEQIPLARVLSLVRG